MESSGKKRSSLAAERLSKVVRNITLLQKQLPHRSMHGHLFGGGGISHEIAENTQATYTTYMCLEIQTIVDERPSKQWEGNQYRSMLLIFSQNQPIRVGVTWL